MRTGSAKAAVGEYGLGAGKFRRGAVGFWIMRPVNGLSALVVVGIVTTALLGPWLAPYPPNYIMPEKRLHGPSMEFPLGTDQFGRDLRSQIVYGARVSLVVGLASTMLGSSLGVILGLSAGCSRGWLDSVILRACDLLLTFPSLILAIAVVAALGPSVIGITVAVSTPMIPRMARVVRSQARVIVGLPYIEAARAVGCPTWRLVAVHLFPNCSSTIIVLASSFLGHAILTESSLNFLGLGLPPDVPTWGNMLGGGASKYFEIAPWMAVGPGIAVSLSVLGFNIFGDAIRDLVDPRQRVVARM